MSKKSKKTTCILGSVLFANGIEYDSHGTRIDIMQVYTVENERILIKTE
jgi:hypothetical protein